MMKHRAVSRGVLAIPVILAALLPASATDLTTGAAGRVSVELITSEAAFRNTLSIEAPGFAVAITGCKLEPSVGLPGIPVLSEKLSQRGCRVTLDSDAGTPGIQGFASGTVFQFRFCAQINADPTCEYVWSSDPSENSDAFDHVQTTPQFPGTYPGRIFQLGWEDQSGGGDMDFNDLVAVVRVEQDTDGDGLWDDWETEGIDTDGDGAVDVNLPALGADAQHKDLFLEIDYMNCTVAGGDCGAGDTHSHKPQAASVTALVNSFAAAPVANPDGMNGINLHVDVDDAISHTSFVSLSTGCIPAPGATTVTFDSIKTTAAAFGTDNPRRFAYHYAIAGHFQDPSTTSTGCGELPGNDFLVTLAGFATGPTVQQEAGTFMHEFGHTLNLRHGGDVNSNRKPNYLSIMSYAFQFPGIGPTDPDGTGPLTARLDYSQSDLPDLDETSLSEPTGVQDGTDATRWCCANYTTQTGAATGAIPWNCDGDSTDVGVSQTINCDCTDTNMNGVCNSGEPPILGTLTGFNDWPALKYDFQNTKDYEDGDHTDTTGPEADLVVALCSPDPRGQGYWHRQCLGTGEIRPGRNGRGPSAPTEANFVAQLEPCADARLEDLGFYGTTTCEGMDAVPPSDPCEKALKHLTATVLNVCSGRLADVCPADLATAGCAASTVGDALTEIAAMIQTGNCGQAASCAEVINEGTAVGMPAAAVPPASATLGRDPAPSQAPAGESREWLDLRAHPELIAKYELRRVRGAWDPTGAEYFLVPASAVRRLGIQQPGPTFRLVSPQEERARLNTRLRNAVARTDEALKIRLVAGFGPTAERLVLVQENRMRLRWATGESRRYHLVPAAPLAPGQDLVR